MDSLESYQTLIVFLIAQVVIVIGFFIRMHVRVTTLEKSDADNLKWKEKYEKQIDDRFKDHDQWQQRQDSLIADLSKVLTRVDERTQMIYDEVRRSK